MKERLRDVSILKPYVFNSSTRFECMTYALSQISSGFYLINQNLQLTHANLLRLQIIPIVFSCENRYNEKFWGKEKWYFGFAIIFWKHFSVFISQLTVNWWLDAENIDYAFSTRLVSKEVSIMIVILLPC